MGIYWLIKAYKSKNNYRYKIKACMGISTFIVTTFVGYTISWAVERDFTKFAYSVGVNYPQNKSELILKANFNWYTTMALMSYGNTDKYVIAQLKMFPYQIAEYDFKERQFHLRAYD